MAGPNSFKLASTSRCAESRTPPQGPMLSSDDFANRQSPNVLIMGSSNIGRDPSPLTEMPPNTKRHPSSNAANATINFL
ncbi:hypothetical protein GCM10028785_16290 [Hydrogenophaga soli]